MLCTNGASLSLFPPDLESLLLNLNGLVGESEVIVNLSEHHKRVGSDLGPFGVVVGEPADTFIKKGPS